MAVQKLETLIRDPSQWAKAVLKVVHESNSDPHSPSYPGQTEICERVMKKHTINPQFRVQGEADAIKRDILAALNSIKKDEIVKDVGADNYWVPTEVADQCPGLYS